MKYRGRGRLSADRQFEVPLDLESDVLISGLEGCTATTVERGSPATHFSEHFAQRGLEDSSSEHIAMDGTKYGVVHGAAFLPVAGPAK
jgi:hypothetical protein